MDMPYKVSPFTSSQSSTQQELTDNLLHPQSPLVAWYQISSYPYLLTTCQLLTLQTPALINSGATHLDSTLPSEAPVTTHLPH